MGCPTYCRAIPGQVWVPCQMTESCTPRTGAASPGKVFGALPCTGQPAQLDTSCLLEVAGVS